MINCSDCGREISERAPLCPGCGAPGPGAGTRAPAVVAPPSRETNLWAMWLHLSMLLGLVIPVAGLIAPIVIWQVKKTDLPGIDAHGKHAVNWIISAVIYCVVSLVLVFVLIGIPMFLVLMVLWIVFPIMAGIKGNNGEVWKYPLSISFLK